MSVESQVDEILQNAGKLQAMLDWCDGPDSDGCIKTEVILLMASYADEARLDNIKDWMHEGIKNMENSFFSGFLVGMSEWSFEIHSVLHDSAIDYLNGQ